MGKEILLSSQIIEQTKFTYCPFEKINKEKS